jgi:hypothetical protein
MIGSERLIKARSRPLEANAGWAATAQAANERSAAYQNKSDMALPVPVLDRISSRFPYLAQHAQHLRLLHSHQINQRP